MLFICPDIFKYRFHRKSIYEVTCLVAMRPGVPLSLHSVAGSLPEMSVFWAYHLVAILPHRPSAIY